MIAKKFPARLDHLHQILRWILHNIDTVGFEKNDLRKIEIASEEAIVNIINHAYQGKGIDIIQISIVINKDNIQLKFIDTGPEFNPLIEINTAKKESTLEERQLGGLGLILIHKYMDEVLYEHKDNMNVLTLIKNIK